MLEMNENSETGYIFGTKILIRSKIKRFCGYLPFLVEVKLVLSACLYCLNIAIIGFKIRYSVLYPVEDHALIPWTAKFEL